MDLSIVNAAALLTPDPSDEVCADIKIALGAVAPVPMRAKKAEQTLTGKKLEPNTVREAALSGNLLLGKDEWAMNWITYFRGKGAK